MGECGLSFCGFKIRRAYAPDDDDDAVTSCGRLGRGWGCPQICLRVQLDAYNIIFPVCWPRRQYYLGSGHRDSKNPTPPEWRPRRGVNNGGGVVTSSTQNRFECGICVGGVGTSALRRSLLKFALHTQQHHNNNIIPTNILVRGVVWEAVLRNQRPIAGCRVLLSCAPV